MSKPKNLRKIYLINPKFQWRFIGFMTVVSLVAILILYISNIIFFHNMVQDGLEVGIASNNPYFDFLEEQQSYLGKIYLAVSFVAFLVVMGIGIFYSHQIAGPLYQLNKKMSEIANGEPLSPVRFRKNDQFIELQDSFNSMVVKIKQSR